MSYQLHDGTKYTIVNEPDAGRVAAYLEDGQFLGEIDYIKRPAFEDVFHTGVTPEAEGNGVAGEMCKFVLDLFRDQGEKVLPRCPYIAGWIEKHEDYEDLLAE